MKSLLIGILSSGVACCLAVRATASEPAAPSSPDRADVTVPAGVTLDASPVTSPFVPDVYPSSVEAARALGKRWASSAPAGVAVHVEGSSQALTHAFSEGMISANQAIQLDSKDAAVRLSLSETSPSSEEERAELGSAVAGEPVRSGTLTVKTIDAPGTSASLPAGPLSERYVEKSWLSDFASFVTSRPDGRWLIGRSDPLHPALSPAEAARAARQAAADEVVRVVQSKLPGGLRRRDRRAHEAVMNHLVDGNGLVADRFPQAFDRGYGTVYREAVLINVSDEALQPLVDEVTGLARHDRNARTRTFAGGLAVMLVTFVLYRLANFVTRGYFTWKLRTVAGIIVVGALLVLSHLP